jgi:thiol-disulfide isomerase/thioredoxin
MHCLLLILSLVFAQTVFSPDFQDTPKTPAEALKIANEPIRKWRASGDKSAVSRERAFRERENLARSFTPLFKVEELSAEEIFAFGQLAALAAEHSKSEKAFAKYLTDPKSENAALARQGLFRALTNQKKYAESLPVAEALVEESTDVVLLAEIEAKTRPLKISAPAQAVRLARRTLAKMLENDGPKVSDADTIFAAIVLVNSFQTAVFSDDLTITAEAKEFSRQFIEKFMTTSLAQNETLKKEVNGVVARFNLIGRRAPAVKKINSIGSAKTPNEYPGKVVVLDFLAHWCSACLESFPIYNKLQEKYQSKGLEIVGMTKFYGYFGSKTDLQPAAEKIDVARLRDSHSVKYGFLFTNNDAESAFGVVGLPVVVLIDRKGLIRFSRQSDINPEELEKVIEKLLSE